MDSLHQRLNLVITYVDKEGPFLKVWGQGQAEKNNLMYVEQFLGRAGPQLDQGASKIPVEALHVDSVVCAKFKDNRYYRARVLSIDYLNTEYQTECYVEVSFIDYGNKDIVRLDNIRSLQSFPSSFLSVPPLATGFILAEAHCPGGGEWKDQVFDVISKELRFREVQCQVLTQATQYYLVKLFIIDGSDIGALFINRGLMQPITLVVQEAVLLSMSIQKKDNKVAVAASVPAQPPPHLAINTYKACVLEPNQEYGVYVSFVNEGPTHFSVQLQKSEYILARLMKEINEINLRLLDEVPLPGTLCLARCQEDGNICRAVVTNAVDNQFKVFYVDFGNYETLPFECLYQIPFSFVLPKVMAVRVALNGVERSTVTIEMMLAFKKFVDNRLLCMKVLPSVKKSIINKCELWDPETKITALDVINRAAQHAYPEALPLTRGFTQPIKVSYAFSCNRFYAQLASKEQELAKLMEDLQISCQTSDPISEVKIGLPCCAPFEMDQLWYRSEIVAVVDAETVKVRYIDYGNEEAVPIANLRMVEGELLTVLRPQAIECCLTGYQNMEPDETRDACLEELILEQTFTMKVTEMIGKKALVELYDMNNYNVASLLLDKLATAKSQVTPTMLVQAGNTLEHRKSADLSGDARSTSQRKPARQNEVNSNQATSPDGSWRQQNKGFDRNDRNDRYNKDRGQQGGIKDRLDRIKGDYKSGDNRNNNWNRTENGFQNSPSISSPVNEGAPSPADPGWGDDSPSPVHHNSFDNRKPRDNKFGDRRDNREEGYKKRFDDRGNREDRGDRNNDRGGRFNHNREDKDSWGDKSDRRGGRDTNRDDNRGDRFGSRHNREDKQSWGDNNKFDRKERWNNRDENKGDNFGNRNNRDENKGDFGSRNDRGGWKNKDGGSDGYRKDFRKDDNDVNSSGSERSFRKGPRTSSRNEFGAAKRTGNSFGTTPTDSWSVSDVSTPIDTVPNTATFEQLDVVNTEALVVISWFHNPGHFYCQLHNSQAEFKTLMEDIQQFYRNRKPENGVVGAPVVGLFPEDNVLYRAQVLETLGGGKYKVFYVDFGNVSTVQKIWPMEKKFMQMPAQAICCSLTGIRPVEGDTWPEPSNFTSYFGKESFMARFLSKDDNKVFMELWDNQEQVAQQLVQANLAAEVAQQQSGKSDIEIPLLLSQQLRVVLKSVNSLSDIIVSLESGLALTCKAHNLEMASETFVENLKAFIEHQVIIFVDNVLENELLDVTFYDNEGNKIVILQPDEGAFENVEPLCPMVIISSQIYGFVSHANETSVFIQPSAYADQIAALLDKMFESYENQSEEDTIIPEEGLIYAVHSPDGNWYRGRVDAFDDEKATIFYVDYGNGEDVPLSQIRALKADFNVPHMLCLQINILDGSALSYLEKNILVYIYFGESGWEGTVQDCAQYTQEADVACVAEEATLESACLMPKETGEVINEVVEPVAAEPEVIPEPVIPSKGTAIYVSHVDSPTEFYIQLAESTVALNDLQQNLQEIAEELSVLENITVGVLCAAQFSVDQQWYRAEVLDADEDITTVRFVDYGNTDVINNKTAQIKTLPTNLLSLAVYATRCSLKLKALEDEWSQEAIESFQVLLGNQENLSAEFIIQDEKTNIVELYSNGVNVKEGLLAQNLAVPCEVVETSKSTCFISNLNSPSEFWVQMENCIDELEWIAEQLSGAEKFPELEDMSPGTLCAALYVDDEMWYRARILSNTIAGIELLFIDYGNSCVSSSLRQLPEDLLVTPPLAQKCCLQKPEGIPYWSKEAQAKFSTLSADGQTIFEMKKVTTGETAVVELLLDGENIMPKILPETEDGMLTQFETLTKFNVAINGESLPNTVSLEPMPGMEWDEESDKMFLKLYPEGSIFQVEKVGEAFVRLYKDGADIRTRLGGVKSNNLNLSNIQTDSVDQVIDHQAGGDTAEHEHSSDKSEIASEEPQLEKLPEYEVDSGHDSQHEEVTIEEEKNEAVAEIEVPKESKNEAVAEIEAQKESRNEAVAEIGAQKESKNECQNEAQKETEAACQNVENSKDITNDANILPEEASTQLPDGSSLDKHTEIVLPNPESRPPSALDDRPRSAASRRSHDNKIVPGAISRPHSPFLESENTTNGSSSRPSSSAGRRSGSHDDKIVPAYVSRLLSSDGENVE
ncbi:maternal protein tudor-like isoform X2 [Anthonomus grandis grandis]|uniref:maternal protein tudor-like isoform X2 n=1 Tax=Anthonomus grandis grandis TaxID=2921223 RepID=UPI0021658D71|nr:maternal protein tudor-like isoform X2 [Anthonomus grandis grandis]